MEPLFIQPGSNTLEVALDLNDDTNINVLQNYSNGYFLKSYLIGYKKSTFSN